MRWGLLPLHALCTGCLPTGAIFEALAFHINDNPMWHFIECIKFLSDNGSHFKSFELIYFIAALNVNLATGAAAGGAAAATGAAAGGASGAAGAAAGGASGAAGAEAGDSSRTRKS